MKKILRHIFILFVTISPTLSYATVFNSESLFQAAATGEVLEDFDSFSHGNALGNLASLGITFTNQGAGLPGIVSYSNAAGSSPYTRPNALSNRPTGVLSTQSYAFSATNGGLINAVGLWNIGSDDNLVLEFFSATGQLIENHTIAAGSATFGGIVNNQGASTVVIRHGGLGNGYMGIDDLQVAIAPASNPTNISNPSIFSLLFLGMTGLFWSSQRKKH